MTPAALCDELVRRHSTRRRRRGVGRSRSRSPLTEGALSGVGSVDCGARPLPLPRPSRSGIVPRRHARTPGAVKKCAVPVASAVVTGAILCPTH